MFCSYAFTIFICLFEMYYSKVSANKLFLLIVIDKTQIILIVELG